MVGGEGDLGLVWDLYQGGGVNYWYWCSLGFPWAKGRGRTIRCDYHDLAGQSLSEKHNGTASLNSLKRASRFSIEAYRFRKFSIYL